MKKKKQPKTVKAWAFSLSFNGYDLLWWRRRKDAAEWRASWMRNGHAVGPIVRIEVPAPKEAKP